MDDMVHRKSKFFGQHFERGRGPKGLHSDDAAEEQLPKKLFHLFIGWHSNLNLKKVKIESEWEGRGLIQAPTQDSPFGCPR